MSKVFTSNDWTVWDFVWKKQIQVFDAMGWCVGELCLDNLDVLFMTTIKTIITFSIALAFTIHPQHTKVKRKWEKLENLAFISLSHRTQKGWITYSLVILIISSSHVAKIDYKAVDLFEAKKKIIPTQQQQQYPRYTLNEPINLSHCNLNI